MMDINLLREAVTVLSFGAFIGIVVYAVHPRNKQRFDEAAHLPLNDDTPGSTPSRTLPQGGGAERVEMFK